MDLNRLYINIFLLILLAGILIYLFRPVIREGKKKGKNKGNPFGKKIKFGKTMASVKKTLVKNPVSEAIAKAAECAKYYTQFAFFRGVEAKILAGYGTIMVPKCYFKFSAEKLFPEDCEWVKLQNAKESKLKAFNNMKDNGCPNNIKKKK
jgi:hypothetical protein